MSEPCDPDRPCPHEDFRADVDVNRLQASDDDPTVVGYSADIEVSCVQCGEKFRWIGLQAGLNCGHPMVSIDGSTLHAPLRPAGADPDFGLGLPGFHVDVWQARE